MSVSRAVPPFPDPAKAAFGDASSPLRTEALIERLARRLRPIPRGAVARRLTALAALGAAVSVVLVAATLGFRPDLASAVTTTMFWVKLCYTLALAGLSIWSLERLARPAATAWERLQWLALPVGAVLVLGAGQLAEAPASGRLALVLGSTAAVCPWRILAFSSPPFLALIWAVRGLAPDCPRLAGAIVGLGAGGLGAAAYALACTETAAPFLGIWYSSAIMGLALAGVIVAPLVLRW